MTRGGKRARVLCASCRCALAVPGPFCIDRPFVACGEALHDSHWFMLEYRAENATTQAPCIGRGGVDNEQEALAILNT